MKYEIKGDNLPVVICHLKKGEKLISDSSALSWMDPCLKIETAADTTNSFLGRIFSKENRFRNIYTALSAGTIAFTSSFPGNILAVYVEPNKELIIQKSAFLACEQSVSASVFFNKKITSELFSGERFVLTKLSGQGICFIKISGSIMEYNLLPGQQLMVDHGYPTMMDATCSMKIQSVSGLKNKLLGGNRFSHTVITGPGRLVLQTMPDFAVAGMLYSCFPKGQ